MNTEPNKLSPQQFGQLARRRAKAARCLRNYAKLMETGYHEFKSEGVTQSYYRLNSHKKDGKACMWMNKGLKWQGIDRFYDN